MRVGLISDSHGNAVALQAVLEDIGREAIDLIVCLGDVAAMGPEPVRALALIQELNCPVVMGNTDEWLLNPTPALVQNDRLQRIADINRWCAEQVVAYRPFIATFQATVEIDLGQGLQMLCFHGTPGSNITNIGAETPELELRQEIGETTATLLVGGHTHCQLMRRTEGQWLINPGSVGLTFRKTALTSEQSNSPWAEYAVLDWMDGRIDLHLRAVPFDLERLASVATDSGMPWADWWLAGWTEQGGWV